MKKHNVSALLAVLIWMVILLSDQATVSNAVNCSVSELQPCLPALNSTAPPSNGCCGKLRQQQPCLCGYMKNPNLKKYVNSPGAKRVAAACKVPIPNC
ncbi:Bifunctional inhibitor/lipid-transfer protein/seed storage 2S albumin superfamily protein [Euphorbia peplus]|nr:Bifunctional inhibitor/lipid-transfer protein/seed storage 2S albumin superfamily protein [Euphorbia peplus]